MTLDPTGPLRVPLRRERFPVRQGETPTLEVGLGTGPRTGLWSWDCSKGVEEVMKSWEMIVCFVQRYLGSPDPPRLGRRTRVGSDRVVEELGEWVTDPVLRVSG